MIEETITLPRHLQIFLAAIKPLRSRLYSGLGQTVLPVVEMDDFPQRIAGLFSPIAQFSRNFEQLVNGKLGILVQRSDASEIEILSVVRDFEHELHSLLSAYQSVRALNVHGEDVYAHQLMLEIYLHLFNQLCSWLDELVEVLSDPAGTLKKRGLPTSGCVNVPVNLTLTLAPQLAKLLAWCDARTEEFEERIESAVPAPTPTRIGWLATLGWTWMGWEVIEHLFGEDD